MPGGRDGLVKIINKTLEYWIDLRVQKTEAEFCRWSGNPICVNRGDIDMYIKWNYTRIYR